MYQSLYNFAVSRNLTATPRKEKKQIRAHIVISESGEYEYTDIHDKNVEKTLCPSIGSLAFASGATKYASPVCEKVSTILCGATDKDNKETGDRKKYEAWKTIMKEASEADPGLLPIFRFIEAVEEDASLKQRIYDELAKEKVKDEWISFSIETDGEIRNAEKPGTWEEWFDGWMSAREKKSKFTGYVISAITGKKVIPISTENFPMIRAGVTGTGAYIGSFNAPAFQSYGYTDNRNLPMSMDEAMAIKSAADFLLDSEINHNDDFNVVYWFETKDENAETAVSEYFKYDKKDGNPAKKTKAGKKAEADFTKKIPGNRSGKVNLESSGKDNVFHSMSYTVTAHGRMYFSEERKETAKSLNENIRSWEDDTSLQVPVYKTEENSETGEKKYIFTGYVNRGIKNVIRVMDSLLDNEKPENLFEQRKKEYGSRRLKLFEAVCFRGKIPEVFYDRALRKTTAYAVRSESAPKTALQIIKTYLIRNGGMTMIKPELNDMIHDPAYVCGRWFAVVEKMQTDSADRELNTSIGSQYYKAMKKNPMHVMPVINDMANIYLNGLRRKGKHGTATYYSKLLGTFSEEFVDGFPGVLTKKQQGMFDLGYYQQKNELYRKKETEDTDKAADDTDNKQH